jgi:formate dehydrogenase accessory protein FdhE
METFLTAAGVGMAESERKMARAADEIATRLRALIGDPRVSEAYVRFRLDLLVAQQAARRALAELALASSRPEPLPTGPLPLRPGDVAFPADILESLLQAIHAASAAHGRETDDLQRLTAAAGADPDLLPTLVAAAAFGPDLATVESLARRWEIYVDALLFVGRALAAPCVAETVRVYAPNAAGWASEVEAHRCPACGSSPSIARLRRADGRRLLTCGLCGSEWEAARLTCAYCGTPDRTALGVLRLDDADARWVETCERCKGYIKTVDERKLAEGEMVLPVVEEAATLHLDLLAEHEGYIRRVPYVLAG